MKIINILTHVPQEIIHEYTSPEEYIKRFPETEYVKINKEPFWIGFFKLDWHHKWGSFIKKNAPEIEIECWRPYGNVIDQIYEKKVDGIKHKVFPSFEFKIIKYGNVMRSQLMLEELNKEIKDNDPIIHIYGCHTSLQVWLLNKLKPHKTPVVIQQLGGWFGYFEYAYNNKVLQLLKYYYEKKALKYVDLYLTGSKIEEKYLNITFPKLKSSFFYNGIDFEKYQLVKKNIARKRLGIAIDKKIILYVGRYYKTKSVDKIIEFYKKINKNNQNIDLYLVGGYENDEFFKMGKEAGAKMVLRSELPIDDYYSAADVYLMPINDPLIRDFGGFGIAPIEALACGTPIVTNNLIHFPGTKEECDKLGLTYGTKNSLAETIEIILKNEYKECRQIAQKYFNIHDNTRKLIGYYQDIIANI